MFLTLYKKKPEKLRRLQNIIIGVNLVLKRAMEKKWVWGTGSGFGLRRWSF